MGKLPSPIALGRLTVICEKRFVTSEKPALRGRQGPLDWDDEDDVLFVCVPLVEEPSAPVVLDEELVSLALEDVCVSLVLEEVDEQLSLMLDDEELSVPPVVDGLPVSLVLLVSDEDVELLASLVDEEVLLLPLLPLVVEEEFPVPSVVDEELLLLVSDEDVELLVSLVLLDELLAVSPAVPDGEHSGAAGVGCHPDGGP